MSVRRSLGWGDARPLSGGVGELDRMSLRLLIGGLRRLGRC